MYKKLKQARHTILIYFEGHTDYLFARHLKKLYLSRGQKQITLKKGTGGGFSSFISNTVHYEQGRVYDEKYIDNKAEKELKEAQAESQKHNIPLIWQRPCLEGVFLRILKGNQFIKKTSASCKAVFYKEYAKENPLTEELLDRLFTKNLLNQKRRETPELCQLIRLMEVKKVQ